MDKQTLSNYGWVVIAVLVLSVMIALATPFGQFVATGVENTLFSLIKTSDNALGTITIGINNQTKTNYTKEQIQADDHLFAIGKTEKEYVVAKFNEDYTVADITINGENSDGIMMSWENMDETTPWLGNHSKTLKTINVHDGIKNLGAGMMMNMDFVIPILEKMDNYFISNSGIWWPNVLDAYKMFNLQTNTSSALTTVNIYSDDLISIDSAAFFGCNNLVDIKMSDSITTIGDMAFAYTNLENLSHFPNELTEIKMAAFAASNIQEINLPAKLKTIGHGAFANCFYAKGDILCPDSLTTISEYAFQGCSSLDGTLTLNEGLQYIGYGAFYMCSNMQNTTVTIPSTVTSINNNQLDDGLLCNYSIYHGAFTYFASATLENFIVADNNETFTTQDGVLYLSSPSSKGRIANSEKYIIKVIEENGDIPWQNGNDYTGKTYKIINGIIYRIDNNSHYSGIPDVPQLAYIPSTFSGILKVVENSYIASDSLMGLNTKNISSIVFPENIVNTYENKHTLSVEDLFYLTLYASKTDSDAIVLNALPYEREGNMFIEIEV